MSGTTARFTQATEQVLTDSTGAAARFTQATEQVLVLEGTIARYTQATMQILVGAGIQADEDATCVMLWEIRRRDGTILRFAAGDEDVAWGGWTWDATSPFDDSAVEFSRGINAGDLQLSGLLVTAWVAEGDIINGLYDRADVRLIQVDRSATTRGAEVIYSGQIGSISTGQNSFSAEVLVDGEALSQNIMESYSAECRYTLYETRCAVDPATYTRTATITAVSGGGFTASGFTEAAEWATNGDVTVTSGPNSGTRQEIRAHATGGVIDLWEPFASALTIGTSVSIRAGCDRTRATCRDKFANVVNFGGFPDLPGDDSIYQTPNAT